MSRRIAFVAVTLVVVSGLILGSQWRDQSPTRVARTLPPPDDRHLEQRFRVLARAHSNQCSLASADLDKLAVAGRLQGSCCRPMLFGQYVEQVRGLRRYAAVREVPRDPYDVPVSLAKQLIRDDREIHLDADQQRTYNRAVRLSDEHGPCCCHCWRWTAFRGQAKRLIVERRFTAARIAAIWDLEDGCGGA